MAALGAAPLGLINDLFTGYPMGLSVLLWSATMLALDLIDRRTMWRDYWIEWVVAAVLLAIDQWLQWRIAALDRSGRARLANGDATRDFDLRLPGKCVARRPNRRVEAGR